MIVQSTGIVDSSLVRSKNVLNFGYILYLSLKDRGMHPAMIESIVRRWIVLSMLTGRYSGSAESAIDYDIKRFTEQDPETFLKTTETGELSDAFWNTVLVQRLDTSVASSPYFLVFLMAQVKKNARGFLSKQITVQSLIEQRGDIHHIFPQHYCEKKGIDRARWNSVINKTPIYARTNRIIGGYAPSQYLSSLERNHDADPEQLNESLKKLLSVVKTDLKVLPGHEGFSTFWAEKTHNPYLVKAGE